MDPQQILDQGNQHYFKGEYAQALECYDALLPYFSDNITILHNHGLTCMQLGLYDRALASLEIPIKNNYAESLLTRGAIYRNQGKYKEALKDFATAMGVEPTHAGAYSNFGNTLREFCKPDLGIPFCQIAQKLNPNDPTHRLNESVCHLLKGDLISGWEKYDARWYYESKTSFKPVLPGTEYNGTQDINGKKILVYAEQGFGDAIQFSRYISLLEKDGAIVSLYVREPLERLMKYNYHNVDITSDSKRVHVYDYHVPMMDLPKCYATTIDTIPKTHMDVEHSDVSLWYNRLGLKKKFRVGIVWSSTRVAFTSRFRQIDLEQLLQIKNDNIELINLEYDYKPHEKILLDNNVGIYNGHIVDFYDMACLVKNLDLVISVDTAIVHLAGSLGIPTWVLLSDYAVDWRWFMDRTDSPFYPSVTCIRQNGNGWQGVIDDVKSRLEKFT